MTRVDGNWLRDDRTRAVLRMLTDAGHGAWFVGGCVRNALLGRAVTDIDIATDVPPERVMELARGTGLKPVPIGLEFGVVMIVSGGLPHEITTLRRDVRTDGRRAVVALSRELAEDAWRRDLTINALYADSEGTVLDPTGQGLPDLKAHRVRFIGDPGIRIREDYLRILRFFRFHATYGPESEGPDEDGLAACKANADGLAKVSAERIGVEMLKLLSASDPSPALAAMSDSGILARLLPGADPSGMASLVELEGRCAPDSIRRLAVLGGENAAGRFRRSKAWATRLSGLREAATSDAGAGELGYRLGERLARDSLLVRGALTGRTISAETEARIAAGAAANFPVSADDLMPQLSGSALGAALRDLEQRWIESGFALGREELPASGGRSG